MDFSLSCCFFFFKQRFCWNTAFSNPSEKIYWLILCCFVLTGRIAWPGGILRPRLFPSCCETVFTQAYLNQVAVCWENAFTLLWHFPSLAIFRMLPFLSKSHKDVPEFVHVFIRSAWWGLGLFFLNTCAVLQSVNCLVFAAVLFLGLKIPTTELIKLPNETPPTVLCPRFLTGFSFFPMPLKSFLSFILCFFQWIFHLIIIPEDILSSQSVIFMSSLRRQLHVL